MKDHRQIISAFGGHAALAEALGVEPGTAWAWKKRGRIPHERWPGIVMAARAKGLAAITCDNLAAGWAKAGRAA